MSINETTENYKDNWLYIQSREQLNWLKNILSRMKLAPCINSLLETDLYKLTMGQMFFHKHAGVKGTYKFLCRNKDVKFTKEMVDEINAQLDYVSMLSFRPEEIEFLRTIRFLKHDYIEFLKGFKMRRDQIKVTLKEDGTLDITVNGLIYMASIWEIYTLAIVNEVHFRMKYAEEWDAIIADANDRLTAKIEKFTNGTWQWSFGDFGLRRRLCREWHENMFWRLIKEANRIDPITGEKRCALSGTSNVYLSYLAHKNGFKVPAIGTCAHESIQLYQGIPGCDPTYSNKFMLRDWFEEYEGDLGTALTDTISTDVFLLDINAAYAKMLSGYRHDSNDEIAWGEKILSHLEKFRHQGVIPEEKLLLFSNGLDGDRAQKVWQHFAVEKCCKVGFGIGTWFTNDTYVPALNIVLKLQEVEVDGVKTNVIKLSDTQGKTMTQSPTDADFLRDAVIHRLEKSKGFQRENCLADWIRDCPA